LCWLACVLCACALLSARPIWGRGWRRESLIARWLRRMRLMSLSESCVVCAVFVAGHGVQQSAEPNCAGRFALFRPQQARMRVVRAPGQFAISLVRQSHR